MEGILDVVWKRMRKRDSKYVKNVIKTGLFIKQWNVGGTYEEGVLRSSARES